MNQDDRERREEEEENQGIVIQDKRHGRGLDDEEPEADAEFESEKEAAESAAPDLTITEPAPPDPAPAPAEPAAPGEPQIIDLGQAKAQAESEAAEPVPPQESAAQDDPPEMAQLKALFGAGISTYLLSQLDLLFNFALIYMGRVPNPATGMVAVDIKQAKIAIDSLDFVLGKAKDALEPEQLAQITQAVAELKMLYLNAAGGAPVVEPQA